MKDLTEKWMDDAGVMYLQQKKIDELQEIVDRATALAEYYAPLLHGRRAQEFLEGLEESDDVT